MRQVQLTDIRIMAEQAAGQIDRIFLHWSAGHYGQFFGDYHFNIDADGAVFASTDDLTAILAHTWRQNTGSVGVSMACAYNATTNDLGPEPPTQAQIEAMAAVVKELCAGLGIPVDFDHVRTHAEQADLDEYGPATTCERWDGWFWRNGDEPGSGGDLIRRMAS